MSSALDNYPYELNEVLENLNYALSYDDNHAAALCLMGRLQMWYLKDYREAEYYLEKALTGEPNYSCALEQLVILYITQKRLNKAQRVLMHAQKLPTISRTFILHGMSRILETRGELKLAKHNLKAALAEVNYKHEGDYLNEEMTRLKAKIKARKKLQEFT